MKKISKVKNQPKGIQQDTNSKALAFISAGVACYAFSLINELGMLDTIYKTGKLPIRTLSSYPNPIILHAAFKTLEKNGIISYSNGYFYLTNLGKSLYMHRGSVGLIYNGYRNVLSNQFRIASDEPSQNWGLVDSLAVSRASVDFGEETVNEMILNTILDTPYRGICDLGCGEATRLFYICRKLKMRGLGIDISEKSIRKAQNSLRAKDKINLTIKDITKLNKTYPEVEIVLQSFVMHDITGKKFHDTVRSFHSTFSNLKMFIYIDAFAPDDSCPTQLPGFDYIHSLLNIKTRTRGETLLLLKKAGFHLIKETLIPELPNCYMWVLTPFAH